MRKHFLRVLTVMLMVCLGIGVLAACGDNEEPETPPADDPIEGIWTGVDASLTDGETLTLIVDVEGDTANVIFKFEEDGDTDYLYYAFTKTADGGFKKEDVKGQDLAIKLTAENKLEYTATDETPVVFPEKATLPAPLNITGSLYTLYGNEVAEINFGATPAIKLGEDVLTEVKVINVGGYKVFTAKYGSFDIEVFVYRAQSKTYAFMDRDIYELSATEPTPAAEYTIKYSFGTPSHAAAGATLPSDMPGCVAGTQILIYDNVRAQIGWKFDGWRTKSGTNIDTLSFYTVSAADAEGDTITLTARFSAVVFPVKFNLNKPQDAEGTLTPASIEDGSISMESPLALPADPSGLTNYTFAGWTALGIETPVKNSGSTTVTLTEDMIPEISSTLDLTFTANWTPNTPAPATDSIEGVWTGATASDLFGGGGDYVFTATVDLAADNNSGYMVLSATPAAEAQTVASEDPAPVYAFAFAITKSEGNYTATFMGQDLVITCADGQMTVTNFASAPLIFTANTALPAAIDKPTGTLYAELGTNSIITIDFANHTYTDTEDEEYTATIVNIGSYIGVMTEKDGQSVGYVITRSADTYYYFSYEGEVVELTATKPAYKYSVHFDFGEYSRAAVDMNEPASVEGKKVGEKVTGIEDVTPAENWAFEGWYTKNGEKVENHEYTVKAEDAQSGYWITLTAKWKLETTVSETVTAGGDGQWNVIKYSYPTLLHIGEEVVITGNLSMVKDLASANNADGVLVGISEASTLVTSSQFCMPRYDRFMLGSAFNYGYIEPVTDAPGDAYAALRAIIRANDATFKATVGFYSAHLVVIKYEFTGTVQLDGESVAAKRTWSMTYQFSKANQTEEISQISVGLGGENASLANVKFVQTNHIHNFVNGERCSCGAYDPNKSVDVKVTTLGSNPKTFAANVLSTGIINTDTDGAWPDTQGQGGGTGCTTEIKVDGNFAVLITFDKIRDLNYSDALFDIRIGTNYLTYDFVNDNFMASTLYETDNMQTKTTGTKPTNWAGTVKCLAVRVDSTLYIQIVHYASGQTTADWTREYTITSFSQEDAYIRMGGNEYWNDNFAAFVGMAYEE